ncbi:sodium/hydrogen exchanger 6 [Tanacetum coccineum]
MEPNSETPIVKSVDINAKPTSYSGATVVEKVKLHDVPIQEDGISLIATYLEADLKEYITIGIPDLDGPGFTKETIRVELASAAICKNGGVTLPKGVPVVKGFQVGKDFAFQPRAPKDGFNSGGSRIILGWNDDLVDIMTMAQTNQVMHVQVNTRANNKTLFCSFVYGDNYSMNRRALWSNLVGHAGLIRNRPWVLMGDFNAALNLEDHSSGGYELNVAMRDFRECVQAMEIDRIMGNLQFNDDFLGSFPIFQPYRISDHSPCVLRIPTVTKSKPKPFKFANFLVYKEGFREVVESGWNVNIEGFSMYRVVKRLKGLKSPFYRDPSSFILREEHAHYLLAFKEAQLDEERFLKQKAKVEWLKAGDSNTAYFHRIMKNKCAKNRIDMVSDSSNTLYDGNHVTYAFVNHYDQFLETEGVTNHLDDHYLYTRVLDTIKANFMVRGVTDIEVKNVNFSMGDNKAPGPDGFTTAFFKKAWDVCMTRSSTNELFTPYKEPEREFRSSRRHFKSLSLDELRSPNFNLFSDQEYSEEEEAEAMAETMEQYMSKTRTDYGSGVARPKIEEKDSFELKGQFLKELRENTFSGSDNKGCE